MSKIDLKTLLEQVEHDVEKEEQSLFGTQGLTPAQQQILDILREQPILSQPTLNWLLDKKSHLAAMNLLALYNVSDIKKMYSEEEWQLFEQKYLTEHT